ncbi:MAG: hypothetical protein ACREPH_01645, partial [Rhodanobacteraceae bacterium]
MLGSALTSLSFPARLSQERFRSHTRVSPFLFRQKGAKNHCAGHAGSGNVVLPKLPLVLAEFAP